MHVFLRAPCFWGCFCAFWGVFLRCAGVFCFSRVSAIFFSLFFFLSNACHTETGNCRSAHKKPTSKNRSHTKEEERQEPCTLPNKRAIAHAGLSAAPHDGAQLKNSHPPIPFIFIIFLKWAKQGAQQGGETLFAGAGRRDDDTSMVLSTAVTSPEAEKNDGAGDDELNINPPAPCQ